MDTNCHMSARHEHPLETAGTIECAPRECEIAKPAWTGTHTHGVCEDSDGSPTTAAVRGKKKP